jgi:putative sigma-54 modulation protein
MTESLNDQYTVEISGKNLEVTKPLRDYILDKLHKIEPFTTHMIDAHVRLDVEKLDHRCDVILKFSHFKIVVHAITDEMYATIDKAFDKLKHKIRKWKGRIQDHHAKGIKAIEMEVEVLEHADDADKLIEDEIIDENNETLTGIPYTPPSVVKTKKRPLKMLTLDEAIMKMELSSDNFMLYKGEEDQALKIIYRRRRGGYGVIIPA